MSVWVPSKFKDLGIAMQLPRKDQGKRICGCQDAVLMGVGHPNTIAGAECVGKSPPTWHSNAVCHFVTLIAPTDDAAAVRPVMERYGRTANPIDNPSIRKVLRDDEHQFLTTRGHCDCGTVLAPRHDTTETPEERLAKEEARMRRKGWSETKIARAIEDRRKADAKPGGGGSDSLELWIAALQDLRQELRLPYSGLFVRFYSGAVATENFVASRREVAKGSDWYSALSSLEHDEVTILC